MAEPANTTKKEDSLVRRLISWLGMSKPILYGDGRIPPKSVDVKKTWSEKAMIITSSSGVTRTAVQCRKFYNDSGRQGKQKVPTNRQHTQATTGGQSASKDLTPAEEIAASTLTSQSIKGFRGSRLAS